MVKGFSYALIFLAVGSTLSGCAHRPQTAEEGVVLLPHQKIFLTDFQTAWNSTLDALKPFPVEVSNRETGTLKTQFFDNTMERGFLLQTHTDAGLLKSQARFRIQLSKGFYQGEMAIKVTVQKEQKVQYDVLEDWTPIQSDGIEEETLLYRVGRVLYMKLKIASMESKQRETEIQNALQP